MTVISISIIESSEQILAGVPRAVTLTTNIPASIFYTLDGSDPTLYSSIYTSPIQLPTDKTIFTLKVFATDGDYTSAISSFTYETNTLGQNARTSHSGTDATSNSPNLLNLNPFGSPPLVPNQHFLGAAEAGLNVNNPLLPQVPSGFDADGYAAGFSNGQDIGIPSKNFGLLLTDTDEEGQRGPGIGTLPKGPTIARDIAPPEQSDINSYMFDPRAMVIIQDLTKPIDPNQPAHINRMFFTLEDVEHARTGNQFFNVGPDAPPVTGSFVRQHYNPAKNTITYYYFDSTQNRWIISITPYTPKPDQYNYASKMVNRRGGAGASKVFQWIVWKGNYLY